MNLFHLTIYLIRLALFIVLSLLFRIYLSMIFLTKEAAPILIVTAISVSGYLTRTWSVPWLEALVAPTGAALHAEITKLPAGFPLRIAYELASPHLFLIAAAAGLFLLWCVLHWTRRILRFVMAAFPLPPRPLPPVRYWTPPVHRIKAVPCTIDVPALPLRYWDGSLAPLVARLSPDVRAIITQQDSHPAPIAEDVAEIDVAPPAAAPRATTRRKAPAKASITQAA